MSYFAASLSQLAAGWSAVDLDLDAVESLDELVDLAIEVHGADEADPAATVVLVEQEDEWFAVVRADPDDTRVFVSDAPAALRHALGEILLPDLVPDVELDLGVLPVAAATDPGTGSADVAATGTAGDDAAAGARGTALSSQAVAQPAGLHDAAGDPDLLADLGVPAEQLSRLAGPAGPVPGDALTRLADLLGCLDALDAIR